MADTLSIISSIFFVAAGVFAVLAIALWFLFRIPAVIGDLSGRTAKKSIEQMRRDNEKNSEKSYESVPKKTGGKARAGGYETGLLNENKARGRTSEETELLIEAEDTGIFGDDNTTEQLNEVQDSQRKPVGITLSVIEEIMLIHTDEVI